MKKIIKNLCYIIPHALCEIQNDAFCKKLRCGSQKFRCDSKSCALGRKSRALGHKFAPCVAKGAEWIAKVKNINLAAKVQV